MGVREGAQSRIVSMGERGVWRPSSGDVIWVVDRSGPGKTPQQHTPEGDEFDGNASGISPDATRYEVVNIRFIGDNKSVCGAHKPTRPVGSACS